MQAQQAQKPTSSSNFVIRCTREYQQWFARVARATNRPQQYILEAQIAAYSKEYGDPCGPPPQRLAGRQ
jgi:hypothetical protein